LERDVEKRSLASLRVPLPTTFPPGISNEKEWNAQFKNLLPASKVDDHHGFPYRYYEIVLTRSLIGMDKKIKHIATSLGLQRRHQVVF
jgi:hypothetical protein